MSVKRHPLHSLCSYLGCFPPRVPAKILKRCIAPGSLVLDPFCGSGTTLLEAALGGYRAIGFDLNPLAVAIAQAKTQAVSLECVLDRLRELAREFTPNVDLESVPDDVKVIFHPRTLAQLAYLQNALDLTRSEDLFLRGVVLGIMHGKHRKGGGTSYLSIDMPNTFSMSPEYVRKFVKRKKLVQLPVDAFGKLRERVEWLLRGPALPAGMPVRVQSGDATKLDKLLEAEGASQVDAIVTSPPYLGILRYGAFNWIRLWFLGFEPTAVDHALDSTDSLDRYLSFMSNFLTAAGRVVKPGGVVALVIGDVVEFGTSLNLAKRVWDEVGSLTPFTLSWIEADRFDEGVKTTRIWGEDKKGRATPLDRILLLQRAANVRSKPTATIDTRATARARSG